MNGCAKQKIAQKTMIKNKSILLQTRYNSAHYSSTM